jgi:nitroimidazol reductase NimA-like FMN-containing flavoprotein (pyridoxamine 5'-phosphate oxidase superfamily)
VNTQTAEIEILSEEECVALLQSHQVGRIALTDHGQPLIFPVNYAVDGDVIVFRTAPGTKLDAADHANVTFEVDEIDLAERSGWSVVVHGLAEVVTARHAPDLAQRTRSVATPPWAPGDRPFHVRIIPQKMTGRRIRAGALPAPPDPEETAQP